MNNKLPEFFIPSVTLSIDDLRTLAENPSAVFGLRNGCAKIYFVHVPAVSCLHALRAKRVEL